MSPRFGRDVFDLPVGHGRQSGEDIPEVGKWIKTAAATRFDDGVEDGAAFASLGIAKEEPVLFADSRRTNGIFDQVVIDLEPTVLDKEQER